MTGHPRNRSGEPRRMGYFLATSPGLSAMNTSNHHTDRKKPTGAAVRTCSLLLSSIVISAIPAALEGHEATKPFDGRIWRSSDPRIIDNPRLSMDEAALKLCFTGEKKTSVLRDLGSPTCRFRKGQRWRAQPGYPPCFLPDFDADIIGGGTLAGPQGRRVPDRRVFEIWTYCLGRWDSGECEALEIRFDRRGRLISKYLDVS
jgi:hypothetical protein